MDEWLRMLLGDDGPDKKKGYDILGKFPTPEVYTLPELTVTAPRPKLTLADQVRRAQMTDAEAGRNPVARANRDEALQELVGRSKAAEGAFKDVAASPLLFGLGGAAAVGNLAQSTGKLTGIDPLEEMGRNLREGASESKEIVGSGQLANIPYAGGAIAANMIPYVGAAKIAPWAAKGAGAALAGRAVASAPVDAVQAVEEEGNLAGLLGEGARAAGLDKAGDVLDKAGESYLGRFATEVLANALPDAALEFALPAVKRGAAAMADQNTRIIADRTGAINLGGADDAVPPKGDLPDDLPIEKAPEVDLTPEPVAGPIAETVMRPDVDEYANIPKFGLDDLDGEVRLRQTMSRVIEEKGLDPKQVVSWDETRKQAEEIGLSVLDVDRSKAAKMSGAEMLAIRNVVGANVEQMQTLAKRMDNPLIPGSEREMIQRTFSALDAQNMSLLDKFTTARSQAGRDLNSLKILGNRTGDPAFWWVKARQLLGEGRADQLGDAFKADVLRLAGEGKMDELYKLIDTNRRTPLKDVFSSVFKAGLLYNPKTHAVNLTGNFLMSALENAKDAPAALGDWVMSLATKSRTVSTPTAMQLQESIKGAKQGLSEAKQVIKGIPLQDAMQRFDMPMELRSGSVIVDAYANTPFKLLSAGDRVFRGAAFRSSLANQAQTLAKAEGLKGDDLARRAQELIAKPSDEMALRAIADAEEAVYQDRTAIGNILSSVQRFEPLGVPVGTVVMPFSRTPGAIATRVAEYSPLGLAGGIARGGYHIQRALRGKDVPPEVQRNIARLFGRGATGTSLVAAGYYLMSEGLLTPQGDKKDRTARDTRGLTGTPEGGLVLGDTFIDIGRFAPASNLLLMGAALYDAAQNAGQASPLELAGTMGGSVLRTVSDQPFFQGVENVQRAADDPGNAGANYLKGVASSAVPFTSILGAAARGTDDVIREPEGLGETIKARIPGLSKTVPAALDQFGNEAKRRDPGLINQMLSPASAFPDRAEDDPILKVIRETEAGISRRRPQRGQTKADVRDQVSFEGPRIERALQTLIRSARFTRATPEVQREMIESKVQSTRQQSTTLYKRRVSRALAN